MILTIDDNITEIKPKEYLHRNDFTEVHIPKSVEKIGDSAFSVYTDMIPSLLNFTVDKDNPHFDEIDGVLVTKDKKKLVAFPTARSGRYTVPDGIEIIGRYAFRMAIFLEEIIMPDSVKIIEKDAFYYCSNLVNIDLGGAEKIGIESFYYCTKLVNVRGENIVSIGNKAFMKCVELSCFKLPDTVKIIGEQAFYGCDIAAFDWGRGISKIGDKAFVGKNISVSVFKEQEQLLSEKIFAMNDRRKFAVTVNFKDKDKSVILKGKTGDSNIKIINGEFNFGTNPKTETKQKKKTVDKSSKNEIKPVLIDEMSGWAHRYLYEIEYNAFGVDDIGEKSVLEYAFSSVAAVDENGFYKRSLSELNKDIVFKIENNVRDKGTMDCFMETQWQIGPYVYVYEDGDILVDLSYQHCVGKWNSRGWHEENKDIVHRLWKISRDLKSAVFVDDINSDEWKFVNSKKEVMLSEYGKFELFIGNSGSVSKESGEMQKHFKMRYKNFVVPDSEESMSMFFEDTFGNIFNFGHTAVYNEKAKGNIGTRYRSYMNIYDKSGEKRAAVKFCGYPIYVFQREHTYYVVTQQDKRGKTPAKLRLYKFCFELP